MQAFLKFPFARLESANRGWPENRKKRPLGDAAAAGSAHALARQVGLQQVASAQPDGVPASPATEKVRAAPAARRQVEFKSPTSEEPTFKSPTSKSPTSKEPTFKSPTSMSPTPGAASVAHSVEAETPETKKARYKMIGGLPYDRRILELAEQFSADGQISFDEARKLWAEAEDGNKVTDVKRATLKYAMHNYKFTQKAANFLTTYLEAGTHSSFYKVIAGKKYDRQLFEAAQKYAADGQISYAEAKALLHDAMDGKGITGTEKDTLEYAMANYKFTAKAKKYMKEQLKAPEPKSYYKTINGVKYDAALLLEVESLATNGIISEAEAERIWADAEDGKGVTAIEKATLKHVLETTKFTEPARAFLEGKLA